MGVKATKIRWKTIPNGWRFTCYTDGCTSLCSQYCRNATCREPHCNEHKSGHMLERHTLPKLRKSSGIADPGVAPETLALIGKLRRVPTVSDVRTARAEDGSFVASARFDAGRQQREHRAKRLEVALQELFLEVRALAPQPPARGPRGPRRPRPHH